MSEEDKNIKLTEKTAKNRENRVFEEKYLYYAEILFSDEEGKYNEIVEKDLKEFGYIKNN